MDYNSNREKLLLPEYGRNIQNMVNHIMTIEDREVRNQAALAVIDVMGNLYPYLRDIADFKHKLWDHIAIMSDFKLDIDFPYDPPKPETFAGKPAQVPYNTVRLRHRHYGRVIELMIKSAVEYEEGKEKEMLIQMIANHMKKCYLTWNKESVSDEQILRDLNDMSNGNLKIPENFVLAEIKETMTKPRKKPSNTGNNSGKRSYQQNRRN